MEVNLNKLRDAGQRIFRRAWRQVLAIFSSLSTIRILPHSIEGGSDINQLTGNQDCPFKGPNSEQLTISEHLETTYSAETLPLPQAFCLPADVGRAEYRKILRKYKNWPLGFFNWRHLLVAFRHEERVDVFVHTGKAVGDKRPHSPGGVDVVIVFKVLCCVELILSQGESRQPEAGPGETQSKQTAAMISGKRNRSTMPTARFEFPKNVPEPEVINPREEQFVCLLSSTHQSIYGFLISLVGDRNTADDLMQEVSLVLWRKFDAFDLEVEEPRAHFLKWSLVVAKNLTRNYYRRKKSQDAVFNDELISKIAMTRMAAEELLEIRRDALHQCLKRLSATERKQLSLYYEMESNIQSVAIQFGKSTEALYMSLSRLRRRLFCCINRILGLESE